MEGRPSGPHLPETGPKDNHANAFYGECVYYYYPCITAIPCAHGALGLGRPRNLAL